MPNELQTIRDWLAEHPGSSEAQISKATGIVITQGVSGPELAPAATARFERSFSSCAVWISLIPS